ncbi:YceI family protein [Roseivirga sp.]|uniref:YceI family protein n=1 Tax=Roseivirga sp. TaxID=1964215 RepID=UPI003B8B18BF
MKKHIFTSILLVYSLSTIHAQEIRKIDIENSQVNWSSSYSFSFGGHEGYVKLKAGLLVITDNKFTGGSFTIDMNSIANTDGDYSQDLVDHLKSDDFFNTAEHPTAQLVITNVKYHDRKNTPQSDKTFIRIDANLTIKGITHPIQFEAGINAEGSQLDSKFKIDRTLWNVNFKSKGIGARLKDGIISDAIEFNILLQLN